MLFHFANCIVQIQELKPFPSSCQVLFSLCITCHFIRKVCEGLTVMVLHSWLCKWKYVYWSRRIKFRQSSANSTLLYVSRICLNINDECPLNKSLPWNNGFVMVKMITSHYSFPKHFLSTWVKKLKRGF